MGSENCNRAELLESPAANGSVYSSGSAHAAQQNEADMLKTASTSSSFSNTQESNKVLWMGDLAAWMDVAYLSGLSASFGENDLSIKIFRDKYHPTPNNFAFIEFDSHQSAAAALEKWNGAAYPDLPETNLKLNWANGSRVIDPKNGHQREWSCFVGDLSAEVNDEMLLKAFKENIPAVRSAKVMVDHRTNASRGYGFVRFASKEDCDEALRIMSGAPIGTRCIRVSAATPRTFAAGSATDRYTKKLRPHSLYYLMPPHHEQHLYHHQPPDWPFSFHAEHSSSSSPHQFPFVAQYSQEDVFQFQMQHMPSSVYFGNHLSFYDTAPHGNITPSHNHIAPSHGYNAHARGKDLGEMFDALTLQSGTSERQSKANKVFTLFVGGIDGSIPEAQMWALFGSFGHIVSIKMFVDGNNFAFVNFADQSCAERAMNALNNVRPNSRTRLKISWKRSKSQ